MSLNSAERKFGDLLEAIKKANPGKPLEERSLEELREGTKSFLQYAGDHANVSYSDISVPASDGFHLPVRIYNDRLPDHSPVLIFYPGCAYIFDLLAVNRIICSRIAAKAAIKVMLVQFRLAPEYPMPTSIYDAYDAAVYISSHSDHFGIDPEKIILGGWCSGAHSATAVSSMASESGTLNIFHQILLSGLYDMSKNLNGFESYEQEDKTVNRNLLTFISGEYYGLAQDDFLNPLISPIYQLNLEKMPNTTILTGEYDALRSDSEAYFEKLHKANIPIEKIILKGQTHNTIAMRKVLSDGPDPAEVIAQVIKNTT